MGLLIHGILQAWCIYALSSAEMISSNTCTQTKHHRGAMPLWGEAEGCNLAAQKQPGPKPKNFVLVLPDNGADTRQWKTVENSGEQWRSVENSGELWRTLEKSEEQWRIVENSGKQ